MSEKQMEIEFDIIRDDEDKNPCFDEDMSSMAYFGAQLQSFDIWSGVDLSMLNFTFFYDEDGANKNAWSNFARGALPW